MQAVVLDLFGTLVAAPTPEERASASSRVAAVAGCDTTTVESDFRDTWHVRHDGTLPTLAVLATRLVRSDASAEIVAAWPSSPLAVLVDAAVFSCTAGAVKPDQRLYGRICAELDVPSDQVLYVGDGGGDELRGALAAGMAAVAVRRRGPTNALAFGGTDWSGPVLDTAENVPTYLAERA